MRKTRILRLASGLGLCFQWALAMAQAPTAGVVADQEAVARGRSIYTTGQRIAGSAVQALRLGRQQSGAEVACVNCHRPSGMGQVEADVLIPPVAGNYLFAGRSDKRLATMDPRVSKMFNQAHDPYTEPQLQQAIRQGVNNHGRSMSEVMPRYSLDDADVHDLQAYLQQLSLNWSPGVTQSNIRLATVITPDVDPARRQAFMDMAKTIVRLKNGSTVTAEAAVAQRHTRHHMVSAAEMVLGTERTWSLDIWELQGDPSGWSQQLQAYYSKQPVFALVSGLGAGQWQPVHDFCNQAKVPCWFPSVKAPPSLSSPYALYFSQGLTLEAGLLARQISGAAKPPKRLIQVYRDDALGRAGAQALHQALAGSRTELIARSLPAVGAPDDALTAALAQPRSGDAFMFWLGADDVARLGRFTAPAVDSYFSGFLAQGEQAPLAPAWRARSYLVYGYGLPDQRTYNLDYFHTWINSRKLTLVDEAMQSEVFFAFSYLSDTLSEMLDNLYRDYLIERAETMLSQREGVKSEQETRDRVALGHAGDLVHKHGPMTIDASARIVVPEKIEGYQASHGTTMYPGLSLGPGQRFASKGGYIVRLDAQQQVRPVSEFMLP